MMNIQSRGSRESLFRRLPSAFVKALAAAAVLVAAALPLAVATEAGAATPTITSLGFSSGLGTGTIPTAAMDNIGSGASFYVYVTGTNFANDGASNVQLTTTAPGVTFLQTKETSATQVVAAIVTTGATTPGSYPITVTDDNGTATSATNVLNVVAAPTITSVTPSSVPQGTGFATVTINGTGFQDYTLLGSAGLPTIAVSNASSGVSLYQNASETYVSATQLTVNLYGENSVTHPAVAQTGAYNVTVTNTDQGIGTLANGFAVTGSSITNVSPSALAIPATATTVTISGAGFEPNISITSSTCTGTATLTLTSPTLISPNTLTATAAVGAGTAGTCTIVLTNPSVVNGGNAAVITGTAVFGVGQGATGGATITSATLSPNAPITPGTASTTPETLTLVGTGLSSYSTLSAIPASGTADGAVTSTCTSSSTGTTLTCSLVVGSGAIAGTDGVEVINNTVASAELASAFTVAGPVIASSAPAALAVGAKVGTVVTLTGTGFNASATLSAVGGGTGLAAVLQVTSPTTATLYVTAAPTTAGTATFTISENATSTATVTSSTYKLTIDAAPTVTGTTNKSTGAKYIGAGAVAVPITIAGSNFATGVTIGSFTNAYGVADPGVTATVTSVVSGAITATVTIAANDTNLSDGFVITNADGGTASGTAFGTGLFISVGPTITAVAPAVASASSTDTFTITGTGFATGAVVTTTPANGTCGVTTFVSATTLTVTCSFGPAGTTATSLLVKNLDGGQATSAAILPAATAVVVTPFSSGASGTAKVGTTSTIVVSGGGFYGQPKATSTGAGIKAVVSGDTGTALTVRVTVSKNVPGWHTLTFTLANGSVFKANYLIKK